MSFTSSSKGGPKVTTTQIPPVPPPPAHQRSASFDEKPQFIPTPPAGGPQNTTLNTPLQTFQSALGIPPPKPPKHFWFIKPKEKGAHSLMPGDEPTLTAKNKGVYSKVLSCESTTRWKYYLCEFSVTIAMFLQIIVGATLTAFGAGQSSHILITCFGAANTALASLLAVLKSQGLPNRIRQDWVGWKELRDYIEERERQIEMENSGKLPGVKEKTDIWQTVETIEKRYRDLRLTNEANRPDGYTPVGKPLPTPK